ncbi:methyltransferase domain-containing protein [Patescibacteria group bacterium]
MKVSVLIVNYNSREYLAQNLVELFASKKPAYLDTEVIVVDNNSSDGSVDYLRQQFPEAQVVSQTTNTGFGAGINRAAQEATGAYYYLLNPDAKTTWQEIGKVVKYLKDDREVGIVGSKILGFVGENQGSFGDFPSVGTEIMESFNFSKIGGGHLIWPRVYNRKLFNTTRTVDWVGGAGLAIRSKLFDRLNGFDEDFFLYFEDIDLCKRMWEIGYKVVYYPKSVVRHIQGASGANNSNVYRNGRSQYIQKHFKGASRAIGKWLWPASTKDKSSQTSKQKPELAYTRYRFEPGAMSRLNYFLKEIGKNKKHILEIGAGSGNITLPLVRIGHTVTALEPHEPTASKLKIYERIFSLKVVTETIENFAQSHEAQYDYIIVSEVLEHLEDPTEVVKQMKKLLKPDGKILGSVPARNSLDEIGRWFLVKNPLGRALKTPLKTYILERGVQSAAESPHIQFFSLSRLKKLFTDNNLKIVDLQTSSVFFREAYYVFGRFFMRRGGRIFMMKDRLDRRLSRSWPNLFGAGWMFTINKK